ncbi:MAG: HAMP domain-containing histidine kinase [Clostridiaceae bacterium]|nr:HAMP domain-containing histidine kinase [Clostridiaceae bacterium]
MRCRKKLFFRVLRFIQKNDVIIRIYLSFAFVLTLMGIIVGFVFMHLYEQNYIHFYKELLIDQGQIISKRVSAFEYKNKPSLFQRYQTYIDEIEQTEKTDVWIVSNEDASHSLSEVFVNAEADEDVLQKETYEILTTAFHNEIAFYSDYDRVYGMTTLSVAVPITDKETGEVIGAVMMVSMVDRQTMGIDEGKQLITFSVFLALVIAVVISMLFTRSLSKPLEKVGKNIAKMANGDYSGIEVKRKHSQIGIIEKSLDHLSGELRKTSEEHEKLEQARRDFFANVSHELRTPITVLRGYTESLTDGVIEEKSQVQELHYRMLQECQDMERLVDDLFVLSKMQNPDFQIEMEPVSLIQIFSDVLRGGRMLGKEKGLLIEADFPEDDPCMIMGDYGRLRQMFFVIVDNAVKFSKEQGKIEIRIQKQTNRYHISIRDYGVGIAPEQLPFIFEKFYTSKMRQNQKGTGLGLMIAKQIALRHGGEIQVESTEGEGTVFFFSFEECACLDDFE